MNFKKSLLISFAAHLAAFLLLPGFRTEPDKEEWVEVSLAAFPDVRERVPDWSPGDETPPLPAMELPSPRRSEVPLEPRDYFAGIPVERAAPRLDDDELTFYERRRESERRARPAPGRRESRGILTDEGEDPEFSLTGPVARREVLRRAYPDYPRWAQEQGVEGSVKLRFWVSSSGIVERVEMESTSGYPEMDSRAMEAMKKWLFEPEESEEAQWGRINIRYSLR